MNNEYTEQYYPSNNRIWLQSLLWIFIVLFFLLSIISLSSIIYLLANNEWGIAKYYSNSNLDFMISTFPFLLLPPIVVSALLAIILFQFTNIKKFFSFYKSIIIFLFLIALFSLVFFYTGISAKIIETSEKYNLYELITKNRCEIWQNPDFGLLSGEIGAITDIDNFLLIDFNNKTWTIKSNNPKIIDRSIIKFGEKIKIIGKKNNINTFEAKKIMPY